LPTENGRHREWNDAHCNHGRAVPPSHGNRVFILLVNQVVGFIGLKNLVMNHGVLFKGVGKETHAFMHHETMQGPFEEGRENYCYDETDGRPEEERYHGFKWVKGLAQAIRNTGFGQVVGGHFETDAVADGEADEVPTHFAGDMGKDFVLVIQHYPEHGAGQNHLDRPFQFNGLFTAHISLRRLDLPSLGALRKPPTNSLSGIWQAS
jgi:hypothetical protein